MEQSDELRRLRRDDDPLPGYSPSRSRDRSSIDIHSPQADYILAGLLPPANDQQARPFTLHIGRPPPRHTLLARHERGGLDRTHLL